MITPDRADQHRDLAGSESAPARFVPTPGTIAVEPMQTDLFVDAIREAGGVVTPVSAETRGLVWLSEKRASELGEILAENPGIEWVQLPWAGVDGFAGLFDGLDHANAPVFTSAKGSYAEPVAEHALTLTLGLARELPRKAREATWQTERTGLSLYGNHIVIIGAGGITTEFIRLVQPFRPTITVVRRQATLVPGADRTVTTSELDSVLTTADVVIIAAAATAETRHIIGRDQITALPPHAIIVNIARGSLLDADAALDALRAGNLWGIGLDVTDPEPLPADHPLWSEPNCVITSHSADTPLMTKYLLAERIRTNVRAFLSGGQFVGVVDTQSGY